MFRMITTHQNHKSSNHVGTCIECELLPMQIEQVYKTIKTILLKIYLNEWMMYKIWICIKFIWMVYKKPSEYVQNSSEWCTKNLKDIN